MITEIADALVYFDIGYSEGSPLLYPIRHFDLRARLHLV